MLDLFPFEWRGNELPQGAIGRRREGSVMAESQTLVILRNKRDEIERAIANYEKQV